MSIGDLTLCKIKSLFLSKFSVQSGARGPVYTMPLLWSTDRRLQNPSVHIQPLLRATRERCCQIFISLNPRGALQRDCKQVQSKYIRNWLSQSDPPHLKPLTHRHPPLGFQLWVHYRLRRGSNPTVGKPWVVKRKWQIFTQLRQSSQLSRVS